MLRTTAREESTTGLVKTRAPGDATQLEQARRWAEQGVRGQEIARRPDVSDTMISRLVGAHRRRPTLTPLIKAGLVVLGRSTC